jgi:hypothetical protein
MTATEAASKIMNFILPKLLSAQPEQTENTVEPFAEKT